jgi:hypothetical protein
MPAASANRSLEGRPEQQGQAAGRYCIICKKIADGRFTLKAADTAARVAIDSIVCADCFDRLMASHNVKGRFKAHQLFAWARNKDRFRH